MNSSLNGDYYPLTPFSKSNQEWVAWQFDLPESQSGLIQGIRLADCPEDTITVHPCVLSSSNAYRFENPETGQSFEIIGAELARDGFTFRLSKRSAAIFFYKEA